jgi:hypothetical protein
MPGQRLGALIGAVFGLIYILVNTGALPLAARLPLSALGLAAFLIVMLALHRRRGRASTDGNAPAQAGGLSRTYWTIVAAEAAALAAGLALLNGPFHTPDAGVAWVSTVVGVHFVALGAAFRQRFFHYLGGSGRRMRAGRSWPGAGGAATALVAGISGVVPGMLLLAAAWSGAHRIPPAARPSRVATEP